MPDLDHEWKIQIELSVPIILMMKPLVSPKVTFYYRPIWMKIWCTFCCGWPSAHFWLTAPLLYFQLNGLVGTGQETPVKLYWFMYKTVSSCIVNEHISEDIDESIFGTYCWISNTQPIVFNLSMGIVLKIAFLLLLRISSPKMKIQTSLTQPHVDGKSDPQNISGATKSDPQNISGAS